MGFRWFLHQRIPLRLVFLQKLGALVGIDALAHFAHCVAVVVDATEPLEQFAVGIFPGFVVGQVVDVARLDVRSQQIEAFS